MAQGDEPEELIVDLGVAFGNAQGRRGAPLAIEVVRGLTAEDMSGIVASQAKAPGQALVRVTTAHHRLAQLIAQGKDNTEVSMMTGYNPAYLSRLRSDPSFGELVSTYAAERQLVFADVLMRMKDLGLSSLDELQARLADEPEKWTKRELMDLAELCLLPTTAAASGKGPAQGAGGVSINVNFVDAPVHRTGIVLEGEVLSG